MSTLSVPITPELEKFINEQIAMGHSDNKAQVVRRALRRLAEEQAIQDVLEAQQEVREGKILRGNLRDIVKKLR